MQAPKYLVKCSCGRYFLSISLAANFSLQSILCAFGHSCAASGQCRGAGWRRRSWRHPSALYLINADFRPRSPFDCHKAPESNKMILFKIPRTHAKERGSHRTTGRLQPPESEDMAEDHLLFVLCCSRAACLHTPTCVYHVSERDSCEYSTRRAPLEMR